MPAALQMAFSLVWVPESSPRETKGAPASAICVKAAAASVPPPMPAGSSGGPTMTKVVVHHVLAAHAVAGLHEGILPGAGMHQQHVGVAVLAQLQRLAGAHGDDVHRRRRHLPRSRAGCRRADPESSVLVVVASTSQPAAASAVPGPRLPALRPEQAAPAGRPASRPIRTDQEYRPTRALIRIAVSFSVMGRSRCTSD